MTASANKNLVYLPAKSTKCNFDIISTGISFSTLAYIFISYYSKQLI